MDNVRSETWNNCDKLIAEPGPENNLESSSNKKELLTALFESSVIIILILEMTYNHFVSPLKTEL
jgi:hypothetical protein